MNGSVDTASASGFSIRRMGNRVDSLLCDVALTKLDTAITELDKHDSGSTFRQSLCQSQRCLQLPLLAGIKVYRLSGSRTIRIECTNRKRPDGQWLPGRFNY